MTYSFYLGIVLALVSLQGCATLFNHSNTELTINTDPQGVEVSTEGSYLCKTPCDLDLDPRKSWEINIKDPRFKPVTQTIRRRIDWTFWLNCIGGIWGVPLAAVDYFTDNMWNHSPRKLNIELVKRGKDDPDEDLEDEQPGEDEVDDEGEEFVESGAEPEPAPPPVIEPVSPPNTGPLTAPLPDNATVKRIKRTYRADYVDNVLEQYQGTFKSAGERKEAREGVYGELLQMEKNGETLNLDEAISRFMQKKSQ